MRRRRSRPASARLRRGFTLIELIIVMIILSLVMAAVLQLYVKGQTTFINQTADVDLQEDVRNPLAWLGRDVRSAVGVVSSWGSYTTSASVLVLKIPAIASDGTLVDPDASFDYAIYRMANGKLQRVLDALAGVSARSDSSRTLGDNVTAFLVSYLDDAGAALSSGFASAACVNVSLAASLRGSGRTLNASAGSVFKLRNRPAPGATS